ncbi:MAG: capsular polysaccharide biosynthesis protein CapF, partial [Lachnospiraceae bacterium]|nr:capsular polysaccharide biosynthesis protein CapF [Lachnospiraceae bacterium]
GFPAIRKSLEVPDLSDPLVSKLYSTYLSFLPEDGFSYELKMNKDERGSFTEFIRTADRGQVSVNITRPGITKGNHWHDSKNEKFLVVKGRGLIRFRKVGEEKVIDYHVSGEDLTVVDIPTGYVHCIINEGEDELVTVMWASEAFDPARPDTYYEQI